MYRRESIVCDVSGRKLKVSSKFVQRTFVQVRKLHCSNFMTSNSPFDFLNRWFLKQIVLIGASWSKTSGFFSLWKQYILKNENVDRRREQKKYTVEYFSKMKRKLENSHKIQRHLVCLPKSIEHWCEFPFCIHMQTICRHCCSCCWCSRNRIDVNSANPFNWIQIELDM